MDVVNSSLERPTFQAKWPESLDPERKTCLEAAGKIALIALKIIFFPIYLAYLGVRKLSSYILLPSSLITRVDPDRFRSFVPPLISCMEPPQGLVNHNRSVARLTDWFRRQGGRSQAIPCSFTTPDGITLDGLLVKSQAASDVSRKVVLYACPNGGIYEYRMNAVIKALREEVPVYWAEGEQPLPNPADSRSMDPDISLFFFNYRGVGKSGGSPSIDMLPLDVYSAYEYLIEKHGFAPSNIVFYGDSMGGGAGACGAALVQEKYPNARMGGVAMGSFNSLSLAVTHHLDNGIAGRTAGALVRGLDLDLEAAKAWTKLKGRKFTAHYRYDDTIPHPASLCLAAGPEGYTFESRCGHVMQPGETIPFLRQILDLPNK